MAIAGIPVPGSYAYPPRSARRRFARRTVEGKGICAEIDAASRARVLDLSEGGMRVAAPRAPDLPAGSAISFSLPDGSDISVNCEMVWTHTSGVAGLRFLAFSHNSQARLAQWLCGEQAAAHPGNDDPAPVGSEPAIAVAALPRSPGPRPITEWEAEADHPGLEALIRKMMVMTAADGAAIVLRKDDAILCRARAGNAPALGARLDPQAGLSGRCVGSGEPVLCPDTESDPTVNAEVCRALRLRAALLVPVKHGGRVEGVFEVFSSKPNVFDLGDIAALQRLSQAVVEFLPPGEPLPSRAPEPPPEPVPAETADSAVAAPHSTLIAEESRAEIVPPKSLVWPTMVLGQIRDPHYREWKRVVYWSALGLRKILSLATLAVPLCYFVYFLVGPVIRPGAVHGSRLFEYITQVVEPGMQFAEDFFSFRAVVRGWNLMFLVVAVIALIGRGLALKPLNFLLRKVEALTQPKKRYGYVPYLPHRTEFH
ncbi:MAG TPA: GAF domain-containing protein [Terriglobales bacterium]|nr:GAF domain-containing protein [Terriglobales bacterium]